eukprot:TRINITY_DN176_c0_g2_i3.p1 TRINITY_DN176_c0_g2~~TRINITY_DN176_c0_g2_i3.p1  ORF type:complete len:726 (-),score=253.08 TRINITY_DN176_c0_g2_i3:35-2212(-)
MALKRGTVFFFQAEDGIRDRSPSRGLGDVYKRQILSDDVELYVSFFGNSPFPSKDYHDAEYYLNLTSNEDSVIRNYMFLEIPLTELRSKHCTTKPDTDDDWTYYDPCQYFYLNITAEGSFDSQFVMILQSDDSRLKLREGIYHIDQLEANETQEYIFNSPYEFDSESRLNLFVKRIVNLQESYDSNELLQVDASFRPDTIDIKDKTYTRDVNVITKNEKAYELSTELDFYAEQGTYYIKVTNPHKSVIRYGISIQSGDVNTLSAYNDISWTVSENSSVYFELFVDEPGVLEVRALEGWGEIRIRASVTWEGVTGGKSDARHMNMSTPLPDDKNLMYVNVTEMRSVFLAVDFIDGEETGGDYENDVKTAYFRILTRVMNESEIKYASSFAGKEGVITWKKVAEDAVNISFAPMQYWDESNHVARLEQSDAVTVAYEVYVTKDPMYLNLVSKTGMFINWRGGRFWDRIDNFLWMDLVKDCAGGVCTKTIEITQDMIEAFKQKMSEFDDGSDDDDDDDDSDDDDNDDNDDSEGERRKEVDAEDFAGTFYLTVRGVYQLEGQTSVGYVFYERVEFVIERPRQSYGTLTFFAGAAVLVLAIVVFLLWKKYADTKKKLEFEMHDVRNVARVNESATRDGNNKGKYTGFAEEFQISCTRTPVCMCVIYYQPSPQSINRLCVCSLSLKHIEAARLYPLMQCDISVSYTHLRAHETDSYLVCRLLLEKKKRYLA